MGIFKIHLNLKKPTITGKLEKPSIIKRAEATKTNTLSIKHSLMPKDYKFTY